MGAAQVEGVEQADRIRGQIAQRVLWSTRLIADRSAGIAVVVADDESAGSGETLAELILPPVHRSGRSVDKEDRRVGGVAEGFDAEVHPGGPDDLLVGPHGPNLGTQCGPLLSIALGHDDCSFG
jgi:hypothetical protein